MKEMKKRAESMISLAVIMVFALVMRFWAVPTQIPETNASLTTGGTFTPRTFPSLLLMAIVVLCVVGIIFNFIKLLQAKKGYSPTEEEQAKKKKTFSEHIEGLIPYIIFAILILYWFLITRIGFLISTFIVTTGILLLLRCKKWYLYLATYVYCGALYLIFTKILYVRLP